jgi:MFS family permease
MAALPALFALRAFHGAAMGCFNTAAAVVVTDVIPRGRRGEGLGVFGMGSNLALAMGPFLSLGLLRRFSSGPVFAVASAVTVVGALIGSAVGETGTRRKAPFALRPEKLFHGGAILPAILMGILAATHGGLVTFLPLLAKARAAGNAGVFFTVEAVVLLAIRAKAGVLSDRWGRPQLIVPGMLLAAMAMPIVGRAHDEMALIWSAALYGLGFGMAQPALMALVADRSREAERARAITTFYTGWELGIGVGACALGYLLARKDFAAMYDAAGLVVALAGIGYALAAFRAPLRPAARVAG